jgi:hypothetical protein
MAGSFAGFESFGWTKAPIACTLALAMALYTAHTDVLKPVSTGMTSWFEAGMRASAMVLINAQPSGY